jgi:aspartokinase
MKIIWRCKMNSLITDITIMENVTLITLINIPTVNGIISDIFVSLAENDINVDMISQTPPLKGKINISFTISDEDLFSAIQTLKEFKTNAPDLRIEVNSNNTKLSLYSEEMRRTPGIAAKTLNVLSKNSIDIIMITTSEVDISYLIYTTDVKNAYTALNELT